MIFRIHDQRIRLTHDSQDTLLAAVRQHLAMAQGFALATLNLDHLVKLGKDPAFAQAYSQHNMVVADGNPIVWLTRLAGRKTALLPGSDLVVPLCRAARDAGLPVSFLGATPEALLGAAQHLSREISGLRIGALIAPPMGFDPSGPLAKEALAEIAALGPGLCLVALGAPKQEKLAALGRDIAPQTGFASIGAGVEFLSGHQNRAPAWLRAIAMEWAWRAALSPRRLIPRYLACFAILPAQVKSALAQRKSP